MRKRAGSLGFAAVTVVLILFTAFCFAGTAASRTAYDRAASEGYYRELEEQMVRRAREFLKEQGFADSGVMLTRVVEPDGSREYTLTVHHGGFDSLTTTERNVLAERLAGLSFQDEACTFYQEFLIGH